MGKVSRDVPLAEITLRKYEKPERLKGRELVKKACLSIGLLQPGDSRDVVVDILHVLLKHKSRKKALTCPEIESFVIKNRKAHNLVLLGIASSNIRRQLKRLREVFLLEKVKNKYSITEFADHSEIFDEKFDKFLLQSTMQRVREHFVKLDEEFGAKR